MIAYIEKVLAMLEVEVRRIMHDRTELYTRAVQPILWIGVFAPVMEKFRVVPIPNITYLQSTINPTRKPTVLTVG